MLKDKMIDEKSDDLADSVTRVFEALLRALEIAGPRGLECASVYEVLDTRLPWELYVSGILRHDSASEPCRMTLWMEIPMESTSEEGTIQ